MPNLNIRRLDEETIRRLRVRAAERGHSMEEEARRILKAATAAPSAGEDYWAELRKRARSRGAGRRQSDSALLIREDRDR
jgi:hypothetical protein